MDHCWLVLMEVALLTACLAGSNARSTGQADLSSGSSSSNKADDASHRNGELSVAQSRDPLVLELTRLKQPPRPLLSSSNSNADLNSRGSVLKEQVGFGDMPLGRLGYSPQAMRILAHLVRNVERQMIKSGAVQNYHTTDEVSADVAEGHPSEPSKPSPTTATNDNQPTDHLKDDTRQQSAFNGHRASVEATPPKTGSPNVQPEKVLHSAAVVGEGGQRPGR